MQDVQKSCNILACHLICTQFSKKLCKILAQLPCKNSTRNYARCSKIMQPSCMLFDTYIRFSKKLCKMFKNHATFLHAIWYVHKILKEIMQDVQKSCNLLACYLIRTQDSQGKYARNVQKQYKKILCKKIINVQKPCNILHNFWQELTIHLHTLHTL